jgi:hypothetical protein
MYSNATQPTKARKSINTRNLILLNAGVKKIPQQT